MKDFYISSNGRLRRKENTIYYEIEKDGDMQKIHIPVENIGSIYLFGETDLNTKVLNFLSTYNIPIHVFNYYGYYAGSFIPRKKYVSGLLVVEQSRHFIEESKRLYLASKFVEGAIFHIKRNLKEYNMSINEITIVEGSLYEAKTIEQIMAIEGNIRNIYYKAFNEIIKNKDFKMDNRKYNPPTNPINALISFGNSVMYTIVLAEIYKTQLEPTISYLHSPSERRYSLSLDIAEIFKPFIIDPIIFKLLNKNQITKDHFDKELNYAYLTEEGRKIFLKELDEKLNTTIKHRTLKRHVSYRHLIKLECYKLIKYFIEDEEYKPFKAWW